MEIFKTFIGLLLERYSKLFDIEGTEELEEQIEMAEFNLALFNQGVPDIQIVLWHNSPLGIISTSLFHMKNPLIDPYKKDLSKEELKVEAEYSKSKGMNPMNDFKGYDVTKCGKLDLAKFEIAISMAKSILSTLKVRHATNLEVLDSSKFSISPNKTKDENVPNVGISCSLELELQS